MIANVTFRDIVKLIHPDLNPNITDAGDKMMKVKLYRNDPVKLYKFAVKWGVITHKAVPHKAVPHKTSTDMVVGCVVYIRTIKLWVTITKITPKMVFFDTDHKKNKRAKISNVTEVKPYRV